MTKIYIDQEKAERLNKMARKNGFTTWEQMKLTIPESEAKLFEEIVIDTIRSLLNKYPPEIQSDINSYF